MKRLASLLLSLAMTLALLPAAAAPARAEADAEVMLALGDYGDGALTLAWRGGEALLVAAGYSEDGRMITSGTMEVDEAGSYSVDVGLARVYRAFALDKTTGAPLCPSAEKDNPDAPEMEIEAGFVPLPSNLVMSDKVSQSTYAAIDAYTEAAMQMEKLWPLLTDKSRLKTLTEGYQDRNGQGNTAETLERIERATALYEQALEAAAVLDVNTTAAMAKTEKEMERMVVYAMSVQASSAEDQKRLDWANKITQMYDEHQGGGKLKHLASQLGCDARKAYKVLQMSQDIIKGKALEDAAFYDKCTTAAIVVKNTASVAMFAAGTIASGGLTAAASSVAAGGISGAVTFCGAVDAMVAVGDTITTVVYGNESRQAAAYSDITSGITTVTCLFSLGGINKMGTAVEKVFFLGTSFMDKKQEALEYIKPMVKDNELGVQLLRVAMTDQTLIGDAIDFCGEYKDEVRKAFSGMTREDARAMVNDYMQDHDSSDEALAGILGGDVQAAAESFGSSCDAKNRDFYDRYISDSENGGGGGGGGEPGGGGGGEPGGGGGGEPGGGGGGEPGGGGGGSGGTPNFPTPLMDWDRTELNERDDGATYSYYKGSERVGYEEYTIDEYGRYWLMNEEWYCGNGDWLVTWYFGKGQTDSFNDNKGHIVELTAKRYGIVSNRYVQHWEGGHIYNFWSEHADYFPNGQLEKLTRSNQGEYVCEYWYSPEGRLWKYEKDFNGWLYNNSYEYYVYPQEDLPYDTTGHLAYEYHDGIHTTYHATEDGYWIERMDSQGNQL